MAGAERGNSYKNAMSNGMEKSDQVQYGQFFIMGYNGKDITVSNDKRRASKFTLWKRLKASGVQPAQSYKVENPMDVDAVVDKERYSITYKSLHSKSKETALSVVVEYKQDIQTDMFQFGRSSDSVIDGVILDTHFNNKKTLHNTDVSTISRFAFRVLADRNPPYKTRIFAAGFNSHHNISLGENATQWVDDVNDQMDGITTNGVLLMSPTGGEFWEGRSRPGPWREVSVTGKIHEFVADKQGRLPRPVGRRLPLETNELVDGTVVDLVGAKLLWRSGESLLQSFTAEDLEAHRRAINQARPQCPVALKTLMLRSAKSAGVGHSDTQPYVYLACGHVQGSHEWGDTGSETRECPICRKCGPVSKLTIGQEPAVYVDKGELTHAFYPCGHMTTERTALYWMKVKYPLTGKPLCPFCCRHLTAEPVKLFIDVG